MIKKLCIIGYGNMGKAFLVGLLQKQVISAGLVTVADPHQEKLDMLNKEWGVAVTTDNREAVIEADVILLAVKPQRMRSVLEEIKNAIQPHALSMSIAAGFTIGSMTSVLERPNQPIVRVMPNLAATVGKSVSGWIANSHVSDEQKKDTKQLLEAVGTEFIVDTEEMLDVVTALSGSGPAYYYYFIEAFIEAAKKLGMEEAQAMQTATQTFLGAAELLKHSGKSPQELRMAVTSKGGTTEAAVLFLEKQSFSSLMAEALKIARDRAKQLRT